MVELAGGTSSLSPSAPVASTSLRLMGFSSDFHRAGTMQYNAGIAGGRKGEGTMFGAVGFAESDARGELFQIQRDRAPPLDEGQGQERKCGAAGHDKLMRRVEMRTASIILVATKAAELPPSAAVGSATEGEGASIRGGREGKQGGGHLFGKFESIRVRSHQSFSGVMGRNGEFTGERAASITYEWLQCVMKHAATRALQVWQGWQGWQGWGHWSRSGTEEKGGEKGACKLWGNTDENCTLSDVDASSPVDRSQRGRFLSRVEKVAWEWNRKPRKSDHFRTRIQIKYRDRTSGLTVMRYIIFSWSRGVYRSMLPYFVWGVRITLAVT
ncbi:unnamed protein product [Tuber aestivum]|uniref:Uncharacterized protein n=1 Tax=Tuber aestivum TaxID=59557 RepID=A0A292PZU3_9PEZI|nr:unnamed protein product [Tuber aestivum]